MKDLFKQHIEQQLNYVRQLLNKKNIDSLIIDAGMPQYYFQDDQTVPFRSNPHFLHFCPDTTPGHILQIGLKEKPKLFYYNPDDYWHEVIPFGSPFWAEHFDVQIVNSEEKLWDSLETKTGTHRCLTPQPEIAIQNDLELVDDSFLSALYWSRIEKTEYEIHCLKEANRIGALGHKAAKESFFQGKSEREIFQNYLIASNQFQNELPYGNIIAFNEKAAILHYQNSRDLKDGNTFLIDAGATFNGYCSDITRTYYKDSVHPIFKELHTSLEKSQQQLCLLVRPGTDYQDIQEKAHEDIAQVLVNTKILNTNVSTALELDLISPFFPHGIGHALGLQVHDVGGKQLNNQGEPSPENKRHPFLRTLREIQKNDVLTIEPGIYFIPLLLDEIKQDFTKSALVNWELVEKLIPLGGIRIEDNVVARPEGPENLTRPFLP